MDSLKVSGISVANMGVYWMELVPWLLAVGMLCLNVVYLLYKIKVIKKLSDKN
jgi:hypothetical protein